MSKVDRALWQELLDHLNRRHASICRQWFDDLDPIELEGGLLRIFSPNEVQQNYLQRKCREQFTEAAQAVTGALVAVRFETGDRRKLDAEVNERAARRAAVAVASGAGGGESFEAGVAIDVPSPDDYDFADADGDQIVLSPDYSFENFIPGPGNDLAYAAANAVADRPGDSYNPLFIHGGVGLGKTHLLQAICQQIIYTQPGKRILYLSCDSFMNQFLDCVQRGRMNQFRHRYRHVDVLVIDDIHLLANKERTQEEFFHTFNALYQTNRQIVLSSDSPPAEIPQLEERLVSRFSWGLVAPVARPGYETRVAIVRAKAALRNLKLSDDVIWYVATKIESNARELEGAVTTLQGYTVLQGRPVTLELAKEALGDIGPATTGAQTTMQHIVDAVTVYYSVKLSDLQSKRRHRSIAEPRQVCMWLARKRTRFSLEEIGAYFGGRDHTTVMHSIRTVDDRSGGDQAFQRQLEQLDADISRAVGRPA